MDQAEGEEIKPNVALYEGSDHLLSLYFPVCQLTSLPDTFLDTIDPCQIAELIVSYSGVQNLPAQIFLCENLISLILDSNPLLTYIPYDIGQLARMQTLSARGCNVKKISEKIALCKQLKKLDLFSNKELKSLPLGVFKCQQIEWLDVSMCALGSIPGEIKRLQSLRELRANNLGLTQFPVEVTECRKLQRLELRKNKITSIPAELYKLEELLYLNLNNNQIENMAFGLAKLTKITYVHLTRNKLCSIPIDIIGCRQLQWLDVRNNQLQIPSSIVNSVHSAQTILVYLRDLDQSGAFDIRRNVMIIGDTGAGKSSLVKSFLQGSARPTAEAERTHVLVKHTLRTTRNQQIVKNTAIGTEDPTMQHFTPQVPSDSEEKNMEIKIYDYGGHPCYEATTKVYLNENSVFVIVFDMSRHKEDDFIQSIQKWVDFVTARISGAHMMLVGTHSDCLTNEKIEEVLRSVSRHIHEEGAFLLESLEKELQEVQTRIHSVEYTLDEKDRMRRSEKHLQYLLQNRPNLYSEAFALSSTEFTGFDIFTLHLFDMLQDPNCFPDFNIPMSWQKLSEVIEQAQGSMSKHWLKIEEIQKLARKTGFDERTMNATLDYLRACGDILWFKESDQLKTTVFHKVEDLANIFKAIMSHEIENKYTKGHSGFRDLAQSEIAKRKDDLKSTGTFSKDTLRRILISNGYSEGYLPIIVELLVKFDIGYMVPNTATVSDMTSVEAVRIPWYLDTSRPVNLHWQDVPSAEEKQLAVKVFFRSWCPPSVIQTISVRLNKYMPQRQDWKNGLYMYSNVTYNKLLVQLMAEEKFDSILVCFRSKKRQEIEHLSQSVLYEVKQILEEWPGLVYTIITVCPVCVWKQSSEPSFAQDDKNLQKRCLHLLPPAPTKYSDTIPQDAARPGAGSPMKKALRSSRKELAVLVDPENGLLDELINYQVLTTNSKTAIEMNANPFTQVERLLDYLDSTSEQDRLKFLTALRKTNQGQLADAINCHLRGSTSRC